MHVLKHSFPAAASESKVTDAGDPVLAFGGDPIKNLLNKIEAAMRQGRFSQRPIGPLGSLLSLADDKWAVAVEFAIGRCFNDFLVSSTRDHDVLKVITSRFNCLSLHAM